MRIDKGFSNRLTGYSKGEFNYDGVINFDDYVIIDTAFDSAPTLGRFGGGRPNGKLGR